MREKLIVILGPTATGKTDLALNLAHKFQGELVSADSRQVYRGLDIGTGKAPLIGNWKIEDGRWIINGVNVWMYDVIEPKLQYNVADYVKDASRVIENIKERQKLPIIVGGTGLYIKALLEGLSNLSIPIDPEMRKDLAQLSLEELQNRLKGLSPSRWDSLNVSDKQNPRRLIRQIELVSMYGYTNTSDKKNIIKDQFNVLKIGLTAPREVLYKRVDKQVLTRIDQGMIEEAQRLQKGSLSLVRMRSLGLEYGVLADYLDGKIPTIATLTKIMQGKIHGYVRRQQTWFKKEQDTFWFDITDVNYMDKVENRVSTWYYQANDKTD